MTAKTFSGLEDELANELFDLGAKHVEKAKRAVYFVGDDALMMRANLCLRTATHILVPIAEFSAENEDELYEAIFDFPWPDVFGLQHTFSIQATVGGGVFRHSKYAALKAKDAIADKFRAELGQRPNVDTQDADYQLNLHIHKTACTLSLNASGQSLDRRGYRLKSNEAPLNEILAAGILLKSKWRGETDFYDPMTGSGTFGIEAALLAANQAPNLQRRFAFQHWADFKSNTFYSIKDELKAEIKAPKIRIYSHDLEKRNTNIVYENAERAQVLDYLDIAQADFFQSKRQGESGLLCLNPPYGERLGIKDVNTFYKRIGDQMKNEYKNCQAWLIGSDVKAVKSIGLKPDFRMQVFNGGLECLLQQYSLY